METIEYWKHRAKAAEAHATEGWRVAHEIGAESDQLKAKLNELAKQDPVAWILHGHGGDQLTADGDYVANVEGMHGAHSTPLFTLPAPAVDLADLVPGEVDNWKNPASEAMRDIGYVGSNQDFTVGANWMRSAILRKIEDAK